MEQWLPVPSLPGFEASTLGRIRRKMRGGGMSRGTYGCITKSSKTAKHSYKGVWYRDVGNLKIHRLVCEAFNGPAPFPKAVVIHLNEDGLDNRPENLRWGTQKENLNMPGFIAYCKARKGLNSPYAKGRIRKEEELLRLLAEDESEAA